MPNEKDKTQNRLLLNEEKLRNEETHFQLGQGPFYKDKKLTMLIIIFNYMFMIAGTLCVGIKFFDKNIIQDQI